MRTRPSRRWLRRALYLLGRSLRLVIFALAVMGPAPPPPPPPPTAKIEARASVEDDDDDD
jgi:hypothetical protein